MDKELISKKELLEITDISYGQLYRWKRKQLIPEEWFMKKSSFTGQETFFPKRQILDRIEKIQNMKEDLSLDEIAHMFTPDPTKIIRTREQLSRQKIVPNLVIDFYEKYKKPVSSYSFTDIFTIYLLNRLFTQGEISHDEGKELIHVLDQFSLHLYEKDCILYFVRKMGASTFFLITKPHQVFFEADTRVITRLDLSSYMEDLQEKLIEAGEC